MADNQTAETGGTDEPWTGWVAPTNFGGTLLPLAGMAEGLPEDVRNYVDDLANIMSALLRQAHFVHVTDADEDNQSVTVDGSAFLTAEEADLLRSLIAVIDGGVSRG